MKTTLSLLFAILFLISCTNKKLPTNTTTLTKFEAFKSKEKFNEDAVSHYPGALNDQLKKQLTERINLAADDFAQVASGKEPTEKAYQEAIGKGLDRFSDIYLNIDTEDRERVCTYFEEIMDIVGLESSDGQLNDFMYKI